MATSTSTEIINISEFLSSILENVKILKYSSYHIVPPGENYGGTILALDVVVQEPSGVIKTLNFVAKLGPALEMFRVMFNIQYTFKREMNLYIDVIPTLIALQNEYKIPEENVLNFFPKCYGARLNLNSDNDNLDENGLMLFENLKVQGYVMEDRMIGFDFDHTTMFIKNLARFHVLPIALKYLKPDIFKQKIETLKPASFGDSFSEEMKCQFLTELSKVIQEIEDCKQYTDKIVKLVDKGFKFEERFLEPEGVYSTIVHNDLWINNFLILKDDIGKPKKIMLYDLQLSSYGSLIHDLIFFLFSSVEEKVFDEHYNDFIKLYYNCFVECLKEFNLETNLFTWSSFTNELNKIGPHQISHIVIMMRPIFLEKSKIKDMTEMDENEMSQLNILNARYKIKMRKIILKFAENKWL